MAIKTVDQIVVRDPPVTPGAGAALFPGAAAPSLPSPLSPGVESVEFNEEEVLKTCQVGAGAVIVPSAYRQLFIAL